MTLRTRIEHLGRRATTSLQYRASSYRAKAKGLRYHARSSVVFWNDFRVGPVYCPCCERSSLCFRTTGSPPRAHARCGWCGALERDRLSVHFLRHELALTSAPRVLHFAPDRGLMRFFGAIPDVDYVTCDAKPGRAQRVEDIQSLSFADDSFDLIYCSHVLEHVIDDKKALREMARVSRPGAPVIVLVPQDRELETTDEDLSLNASERRLRYGLEDHVRLYGLDFAERIREQGLNCEERHPIESFSSAQRERLGLNPDVVFLCWKGAKDGLRR